MLNSLLAFVKFSSRRLIYHAEKMLMRCQAWRNQHTDNLVAVLNEAMLQCNFPMAAEAAAVLLLATVRHALLQMRRVCQRS